MIPDSAQSAKIGEVPVGSAKVITCADECATCSGTPGNCVECEEFRDGAGCPCIDGYFEEEVDGVRICSPCSFRCLKCSSVDFCIEECAGETRINPDECGCPDGYWDDNVSVECQLCDTDFCKKCEGSATKCTECSEGRDPIEDCPCIAGTYDDLTDDDGTCYSCSYQCETCTEYEDSCDSCNDVDHRIFDD